MKRLNKIVMTCVLLLGNILVNAQQPVEMADTMRAEGKIYVLLAIILTVLAGFIAYLFMLDRKISNMEKQVGLKKKKAL